MMWLYFLLQVFFPLFVFVEHCLWTEGAVVGSEVNGLAENKIVGALVLVQIQ